MMTDNVSATASLPRDAWHVRRMVAACLLGTACAVYIRIFDFWPLGGGGLAGELRGLLDFPGSLLLFLPTYFMVFIWFVSAIVALFRRHIRLMASNVIATALAFGCLATVITVPIFDPWFWYVVINKPRLEALVAANQATGTSPRSAIIDEWDVSTGFAGVSPNHFIALIYDENDGADIEVSDAIRKHLYSHFYRRDTYQ